MAEPADEGDAALQAHFLEYLRARVLARHGVVIQAGRAGETLALDCQLQVLGAEVASPSGDAVRIVDCEQRRR